MNAEVLRMLGYSFVDILYCIYTIYILLYILSQSVVINYSVDSLICWYARGCAN